MKLSTLRGRAVKAMTARGHLVLHWHAPDVGTQLGVCMACAKEAWLVMKPAANETHISGDAVAVDCGCKTPPKRRAARRARA